MKNKSKPTKKNIIIFTIDDNNFMPQLLTPIINKYNSQISYVYISKSLFSFSKLIKKIKFFIRNYYPFCISFYDLLKFIIKKKKNLYRKKNIINLLKKNNIDYSYVKNINDPKFIQILKSKKPDLFLFAVFDQIANNTFISIPKFGTFNVHLGPLPNYKGGLSAFWLLRNSEKYAGASIHFVTSKIDEGDLIDEINFKIKTKSMYQLMKQNISLISIQIPKTVKNILENKINIIDTSKRRKGYYLYPTKEDFNQFYKNKNRLI